MNWDQLSETYEIIGELGEGSGGIVYKARQKRLRKDVVLKKIRSHSSDPEFIRREADILKNLNNTYLPQVLDFLEVDNDIYTVMNFIPGKTFQQYMKEGYQFKREDLIVWAQQLCSALNYLHSQNPPIIHSDIKPSNIILTPQGSICLIDFNISFMMDKNSVTGYTRGFSSPEQYEAVTNSRQSGSQPQSEGIDERSDIYGVGATLYYLITGEKIDLMTGPDKKLLERQVGKAFAQVIIKATKRDKDDRYYSAYEMYQDLLKIPESEAAFRKQRRKRRLITLGVVAAVLICILGVGLGVRIFQNRRENNYNELVEQQIQYRTARNWDAETAAYEEAVSVSPSSLECYYQHAEALYEQQDYDACISFINENILGNGRLNVVQERMADVYYLLADSYFQKQEYNQAVGAYEGLSRYDSENAVYYRDYAITLAYAGDYDQAEQILQTAKEYGLTEDYFNYAEGELKKAEGDLDTAMEAFQSCMQDTSDSSLQARAYLSCADIYEQEKELDKKREILLTAKQELPSENQLLILNELIATDIQLEEQYDTEAASQYVDEAIDLLNQVINQGWATIDTYNNLVVLYEERNNLTQAATVLQEMQSIYGEDYRVYKRLAFLELDKQQALENANRNYQSFVNYYEQALSMYEAQTRSGQDADSEMDLLQQLYAQVQAGGWLSETPYGGTW